MIGYSPATTLCSGRTCGPGGFKFAIFTRHLTVGARGRGMSGGRESRTSLRDEGTKAV